MRSFSIDPKYGLKALDQMQNFVFKGQPIEFDLPAFINESYSSAKNFREQACQAMKSVGLGPLESGQGCRLKRFMNRLFGLPLQIQNHIFELFQYLVR